MSLSSAVHAAVSGLGVSARRAETVASNVANASSAGYARRSLDIVANPAAPGVRILDTHRQVDRLVLAETRLSHAELGQREYLADQMKRLESAIGVAGSADSVSGVIDRLQSALIGAAGNPASESRLAEVADATSALAQRFSRASEGLHSIRIDADRSIADDVQTLNTGLSRIAGLDRRIAALQAAGRETASLQDLKQKEIDSISRIVPLKESVMDDGRSVLTTANGAVLLDRRAAVLSFRTTPTLSATGPEGGGITINGNPALAIAGGSLDGGTLSAAFTLRDQVAPRFQQELDALAVDLGRRLATADPTLSATGAGLITDDGNPIDASRLAGLSARLQLNEAADFDQGGALWRIRSGLGAAVAAPSGSSAVLNALQSAIASLPGKPSDRAAALVERAAQSRIGADGDRIAALARTQTLESQRAEGGINTDAELQDLMQIEKSYAANARVLQAVDEMLTYLLAR